MKRTNIVLDEALVDEARRLTGLPTTRAVVDEALRTLVRLKRRTPLSSLHGKVRLADGYDYKALRAGARRAGGAG
jgi:Arc/MetJ family transcription regulator